MDGGSIYMNSKTQANMCEFKLLDPSNASGIHISLEGARVEILIY